MHIHDALRLQAELSPRMSEALSFYPSNPQGSTARTNCGGGGTHGALVRRGLVALGRDERGAEGYFLSPRGWAYLRRMWGVQRPADENRLTLEAALTEAYSALVASGPEILGTIWVCQDCMLHHANGECGSCHDGHDEEPLSAIGEGFHEAMGMTYEEHADDCLFRTRGSNAPGDYECDCEINTYSTLQCEGCGSYLHGERHAMTLFRD